MRPAGAPATMVTMSVPTSVPTYLGDLGSAVGGPARLRRDLLQEAADHLDDAVDAYQRAGYDRVEAEERAVADFGTVEQVAPGFRATVAVASARRTALILVAALAIQPFLWDSGLELAASGHAARPDGWLYAALDVLVEVGGLAGLVGAVATLAVTGIGRRWLPVGRRSAQAAAWYALSSSVAIPVIGVAMLALSGGLTLHLVGLLTLLMVLPLACAGLSARRTLAAC